MTRLTRKDLEAAIASEYRLGTVGYSERDTCGANAALRAKGDSLVIRVANSFNWTYQDLLIWVDSKYGRWFWDSLYGSDDLAGAQGLVRKDWITDDLRFEYDLPPQER